MAGHEQVVWRKSSYCDASNCVEVAFRGHVVMIRHSDNADSALTFSRDEWSAFIAGVKAGELAAELPDTG